MTTSILTPEFRTEAHAKALKMIKARKERTPEDNRIAQLLRRF